MKPTGPAPTRCDRAADRGASRSLQFPAERCQPRAMPADLRPIIEEIARRADDFLTEGGDRRQGRAGIEELLTMDYPALAPPARAAVVAGVMQVLEEEDFFATEFVGDPFSDPDEPAED